MSCSSDEFDEMTYCEVYTECGSFSRENNLCIYQVECDILYWLTIHDEHKAPGALLLQVICGIETDLMLEQCIAENLGIQRHVPGKQS